MRALDALVPEFPFELARHFLVLAVIVAVADRRHAVEVDARPDDMAVLAAFLLMHHDDARLAGEAELRLQPVDRIRSAARPSSARRRGC